jgi:hypothetical protein
MVRFGDRFVKARAGNMSARLEPKRTDLRTAKDWAAYVKSWRRADRLPDDAHLPVGAIFLDAPFGPEMVVVPSGTFTIGEGPEDMAAPQQKRPQEESGSARWGEAKWNKGMWEVVEPETQMRNGRRPQVTIAHRLAVGRAAITIHVSKALLTNSRPLCRPV